MNKEKESTTKNNVLEDIAAKAKRAGTGFKKYLYEEETVKHVSLVLYDLLPLTMKIGMRYEKFHEIFSSKFKSIRNALLGSELEKIISEDKPVKSVVKKKVVGSVRPKPKKSVKKVIEQLDRIDDSGFPDEKTRAAMRKIKVPKLKRVTKSLF